MSRKLIVILIMFFTGTTFAKLRTTWEVDPEATENNIAKALVAPSLQELFDSGHTLSLSAEEYVSCDENGDITRSPVPNAGFISMRFIISSFGILMNVEQKLKPPEENEGAPLQLRTINSRYKVVKASYGIDKGQEQLSIETQNIETMMTPLNGGRIVTNSLATVVYSMASIVGEAGSYFLAENNQDKATVGACPFMYGIKGKLLVVE